MTEARARLFQLLGDLPARGQVSATLLSSEEREGYRLETLQLDLNGIETVPAYVALPHGMEGRRPLVLFNHSHGGNFERGKEEFLNSSEYLQRPSFAREITGMGCVGACIDMWCFGQRRGRKESERVKEFLVEGRTVWGMRLFDDMAFLDYLCARPEVDAGRIATIGMSMGGLMSWWLAALDERVKVTVDIAGQVDVETLIVEGGLDGHGFYYYVPGLLKSFSTLDVQAMIAPRARLSIAGRDDRQCPLHGVERLDAGLRRVYEGLGAAEKWKRATVTGGHLETAEGRYLWKHFLEENL